MITAWLFVKTVVWPKLKVPLALVGLVVAHLFGRSAQKNASAKKELAKSNAELEAHQELERKKKEIYEDANEKKASLSVDDIDSAIDLGNELFNGSGRPPKL